MSLEWIMGDTVFFSQIQTFATIILCGTSHMLNFLVVCCSRINAMSEVHTWFQCFVLKCRPLLFDVFLCISLHINLFFSCFFSEDQTVDSWPFNRFEPYHSNAPTFPSLFFALTHLYCCICLNSPVMLSLP